MGASGIKPCLGCRNIHSRTPSDIVAAHGLLGLDCTDLAMFDTHTNESVFEMADFLEWTAANNPAGLEALQTHLGLKLCPTGVMYDPDLRARGIYRPVDNMIRDWMHVLLNQGVANS